MNYCIFQERNMRLRPGLKIEYANDNTKYIIYSRINIISNILTNFASEQYIDVSFASHLTTVPTIPKIPDPPMPP
jgi:hypothetical protein